MNVSIGYIICVDSLCEGVVPLLTDRENSAVLFHSELEAQREIVDAAMTRLQEFLDDERAFDDALSVNEFVQPVEILPDGSWRPEIYKTT